jgi:hypothetical protein
MDDCQELHDTYTTLPPRRILMALDIDAALAQLRRDYGLPPRAPILSSENEPPRRSPLSG